MSDKFVHVTHYRGTNADYLGEVAEGIMNILDAIDYPTAEPFFDNRGICIRFYPNKKVKEIANYYCTDGKSYREFDEKGKIIAEECPKTPLPVLKDLSEEMKTVLKKEGVWDNVVLAFNTQPEPKFPKSRTKHKGRLIRRIQKGKTY